MYKSECFHNKASTLTFWKLTKCEQWWWGFYVITTPTKLLMTEFKSLLGWKIYHFYVSHCTVLTVYFFSLIIFKVVKHTSILKILWNRISLWTSTFESYKPCIWIWIHCNTFSWNMVHQVLIRIGTVFVADFVLTFSNVWVIVAVLWTDSLPAQLPARLTLTWVNKARQATWTDL